MPKLLLYLGKIGVIGLEHNSEGKFFVVYLPCQTTNNLVGCSMCLGSLVRLSFVVELRECLSSGVKSCCKALKGIISLYLLDLEWSFLSMITTCDVSANIHVACSTSLVTRGSCLSHSKLELHLTNFR